MIYKIIILIMSFSFIITADLENSYKELLLNRSKNDNSGYLYNHNDNNTYLEERIDPENYIVGPGDVFLFNMISTDGVFNTNLTVSPLGTVLIPNVGNILIDQITLKKAFKKIESSCLNKYSNAKIYITLKSLRKFKIQISGHVNKTGFITVDALTRISDIYNIINTKQSPDMLNEVDTVSSKISLRNIDLKRDDGSSLKIDLLRYFYTGDKLHNPIIKQGDRLHFELINSYINIKGGVKLPGKYEYAENESLFELIELCGGFTENADTNYIELFRFVTEVDQEKYLVNNLNDLKLFKIKSNDFIHVRYKKDYKRIDTISITGEVNFPGDYIYNNSTTIHDIIILAGGFTSKADTNKIIVKNETFNNDIDSEFQRIMLIDDKDRTSSEKSYIKSRNKIKKGLIISEDVQRTKDIYKYKVQKGDSILIIEKRNHIEIIGAIRFPGRYQYNDKITIKEYISLAGGKTNSASRALYIIDNASNQKVAAKLKNTVNNGDIIFIESKDDFSIYNRFKEAMIILGQAATIIAVINIK